MNKLLLLTLISVVTLSTSVQARDSNLKLSIKEAMESADFKEKLDPDVHFYFGKQSHPKVVEKISKDVSNKKTNAFNKSDEEACKWALLSTLLSFQDKAKSLGANAVINVESYYKKNAFSSETEYECHAGNVIAGVAIRGDIVKLAK